MDELFAKLARIVKGLEGAVVDVDVMKVAALEASDAREYDIRVAGPAALLVAKVFKINDRRDTDRQNDKDALDVIRLLRGTTTAGLAGRMKRALEDARSAVVAKAGMDLLQRDFGMRDGLGVQMAIRAVGVLADHDELAASCEVLVRDLVNALER